MRDCESERARERDYEGRRKVAGEKIKENGVGPWGKGKGLGVDFVFQLF